ncbi:rhomboid family protein [Thiorhodovibrio frisius]|uniref:Putative membrane protein n=1 Tax=Thiorhodovibrio frisius TaxID=631362 RepID=H8YW35_9GAMM|nr:rhomboid family intramembrane serine protease [Thiorhodovibrio frisius]EIC23826.1 putative membrane protein [Thiorhodovibrio frisius]WPL22990.1 Rhomboid family protein [Thiorhodovibrio frisius]
MLLPYVTALRLGKIPWITLTVVVLCTFIYWKQAHNEALINAYTQAYCRDNTDLLRAILLEDYDETAVSGCQEVLPIIHSQPDPEAFFERLLDSPDLLEGVSQATLVDWLKRLYQDFLQSGPPWSLDASLMYDPLGWNPLRVVTSSLAHADWAHLIFNMIFFIAFAPALELLVGGKFRYLAILVATAFAASFAYSITVVLGAEPLPTLGFSGVVMGMIGLSAFLMPKARIKTFYWVGVAFGHFYIPAWILALWFIGWDAWRVLSSADVGNVNVIAHVAGGVAGYLIGFYFLKDQRALNQDDLDEEVWYQRLKRQDGFGGLSSYRKRPETYANEERLLQAKRDYQSFIDRLLRAVRVRKNSEAVLILLEYFELYAKNPEAYEDIFQDMKDYGNCRAVHCAGRLVIFLYLRQGKIAAAFRVLEECLQLSEHFSLGSVDDAAELFRHALACRKPEVAKQIVRNAPGKYGQAHALSLRRMARDAVRAQ